jgi:UDP-N-acetylglucosamine--N-acetylmuramyl-(pentapeptide) pyrophosphoryl-undecaprenol N-acetylglucosamine transferase
MANRILSRFVDVCLVVFDEAGSQLKNKNIIRTHMPVRKEIENIKPGAAHDDFHLLVFGGSQGARPITNAVMAAIKSGGAWLENTKVVLQTGAAEFEKIKAEFETLDNSKKSQVEVLPYLHDMPSRYSWADLVVGRSGTGTISELAACGKAALLIPLPTSADDHQTKNAEALVKLGGAELLKQNDLTTQHLSQQILAFKSNRARIEKMQTQIQKFHKPNAGYEIAKIILSAES